MKRIMSKFTLNLSGIQRSAMNQDDLKLLEYVTSSGRLTLQSDREIYRFLEYRNGLFYHRTGSTEMNEDTSFNEITKEEAVELLINLAAGKAMVWSLGEVQTAGDALRVLSKAP